MQLYYQNVRGLRTKTNELFNNVVISEYCVIALTETWLHEGINDGELFGENYLVFRKDRDQLLTGKGRGGGVLLAVKNYYNAEQIHINNLNANIDILCLKLRITGQSCIFIILIYIPPNTQEQEYDTIYETVSNLSFIFNSKCLLLGDINISDLYRYCLNKESALNLTNKLRNFINFCDFLGFTQYNSIPNRDGHILDVILSNMEMKVTKELDVLTVEDSLHPTLNVTFFINTKMDKNLTSINKHKYNFKKANFEMLYEKFRETDWGYLDNCTNVNDMVELFYQKLRYIFDQTVPLSKKTKQKFPVWFTKEIIKLIKEKENFRKRNQLEKYKSARSKLKTMIKNQYKQYIQNIQDNIKNNDDAMWDFVQSKKNAAVTPSIMYSDTNTLNSAEEIVQGFATYFKSVYTNSEQQSTIEPKVNNANLITLKHITEDEIKQSIKKLKNKKSVGPDEVPTYIVKGCSEFLVKPLQKILNTSLKQGVFPTEWKRSRVCPIHKQGRRDLIQNYRPISILSVFAKIYESILFKNIYNQTSNIIDVNQHGFFQGRSAVTNLCNFTQAASNALVNRKQIDVIYTDFSKAFDKVYHSILLNKMADIGFSDNLVKLFTSYLIERKQHVECMGYTSESYSATSGVPQGSNLGPLLFIIFINDIQYCIRHSDFLMYADDFKIFKKIVTYADCEQLQQDLTAVYNWSINNKLPFNINKCLVISYTRKLDNVIFNYAMNNSQLNRKNETKDLGVLFQSQLTFTSHITSLENSCYKILGFIFRITRDFNNTDIIIKLFNSLIRTKLEYATEIWNPYYTYQKLIIEKIQKKCLRYCFFKKHNIKFEGTYPELLQQFSAESLEKRRFIQQNMFLYKIVNDIIKDSNLLQNLNFNVPAANLRRPLTFTYKCPKTNYQMNSPLVRMCNAYNNIEVDIDIFGMTLQQYKAALTS